MPSGAKANLRCLILCQKTNNVNRLLKKDIKGVLEAYSPYFSCMEQQVSFISIVVWKTSMRKAISCPFKLGSFIFIILFTSCSHPSSVDYYKLANPFIGTTGGGNTFPGAASPFGMVSVSPHTNDHGPSGFLYERKYIKGFGHLHLSGTGCESLGSVILMPTKGSFSLEPTNNQSEYDQQEAMAGYYKVNLKKYSLLVETTATLRSGIIKITNQGNKDTVRVIIDAGRSLSNIVGGSIKKESDSEVSGYNFTGGFCGYNFTTQIYFSIKATSTPLRTILWKDKKLHPELVKVASDSVAVGVVFEYLLDKGQSINFHTGISYSNEDKAVNNLKEEQPVLSFEEVKTFTQKKWNEYLGKVEIETDESTDKRIFYTALYHMLLQPTVYSDTDGSYRVFGKEEIKHTAYPRYTIFSLWDTYRTVHPFYTLVYPREQRDMIESMLDIYRESGWLPKWELAGNETDVMVGDPAAIVIADSWIKGIVPNDTALAYEAIKKSSISIGVAGKVSNPLRSGWKAFLKYGYIPNDNDANDWVWGSVASSLEYAVADFGVSQIAARLGKEKEQKAFLEKSHVFKEYFDSTTFFLRPKNKSGQWYEPFHPDTINTRGGWPGSGGPGYVEGNAWHYSWFVPHAIPELIKLYPSTDAFVKQLDQCFESGNFILWNEPDMNYPYIYNYIQGREYKTSEIIFSNLRKHFKNEPSGLPGNDDCGTISGWYVFASLGFYPFSPGLAEYALNVPSFKKATIYLDEKDASKKWMIENLVTDFSKLKTVKVKVKVNGTPLQTMWINHSTIRNGGIITYYQ
jgi:predicted alpha-1,2-mannosidase